MPPQASIAPNTNCLGTIVSPPTATLDIVAVHGMNLENNDDHANNTWTDKESGTNWLRDLLSSQVPNSRILAYQYNANVALGTSSAGVEEQAMNLLNCLRSERKVWRTLIEHYRVEMLSMGGIIVKEALATAYHGDGTHTMIWNFTYGIFFLAVPHRGSAYARLGRAAACIAKICQVQPDNSFLNSVEFGSRYNEALNARFKPLLERYKIFSFCETLPVQKYGLDFDIVNLDPILFSPKYTSDLARLSIGTPQSLTFLTLRRSSFTLTELTPRFASLQVPDEPEWKQLCGAIQDAAKSSSSKYACYSLTISERKKRIQESTWPLEEANEQTLSMPEAIGKARDFPLSLDDDSKDSSKLHGSRQEVSLLNAGVATIAVWLWGVLQLITALVPIVLLIWLQVLPSKVTVMDKAEEARQSGQKVAELERLAIGTLDAQLYDTLETIDILKTALDSELAHNEDTTTTNQSALARSLLGKLDNRAEQIIRGLQDHHRAYDRATVRVMLIEEGQREAQDKEGEEFWIRVAENARREKAKLDEEEEKQEPESRTCPECIVLGIGREVGDEEVVAQHRLDHLNRRWVLDQLEKDLVQLHQVEHADIAGVGIQVRETGRIALFLARFFGCPEP
ncbi:uncharacterized protein Z519_12670 [Cladophialophora bantiana CBS 173.52]|uniref:DUF676 domain-containing protein n=1 Tax=Cladophialophora bantiana (strain ATCC 10958 / CBS 173.52 / CDC B-1940 / NIH 8579) TaxID=1442370 RepID=A0A0D2FJ78_CLAB1|nr:uncharacterized protein Z519_12670 [Cladophialophora bantiana CBS 173.52]KIW86757.1 hypothetical protein Z519_12670 [Cladophialophora bantiana CBS 173.52]